MKISLIRFSIGLCALAMCVAPMAFGLGEFQLKDSAGNVTVSIDGSGNMQLDGYVHERMGASLLAPDGSDFVVKDSGGNAIARFDADSGNLFLKGGLIEQADFGRFATDENCTTCSDCQADFTPANSSGNSVQYLLIKDDSSADPSLGNNAWIDEDGNMILQGTVTENAAGGTASNVNVKIEIWTTEAIPDRKKVVVKIRRGDPVGAPFSTQKNIEESFLLPSALSKKIMYTDFHWGAWINEIQVKAFDYNGEDTIDYAIRIYRLAGDDLITGILPTGSEGAWTYSGQFSNVYPAEHDHEFTLNDSVLYTQKFMTESAFDCSNR